MNEATRNKHLQRIKHIFKENFLRDLSDEEALEYLSNLEESTRRELEKMPDFTEQGFERYMAGDLQMVFSPNAINSEVRQVIDKIGIEALEASSKYKRMGEMVDASCMALALKKVGLGEWMIKGQDAPDILLVRGNGKPLGDKPFHAISLEVMQIPQIAKDGLQKPIETEAAKFVRSKKFNKRYEGIPHLLVHLNFEHENFNLKEMSRELQGMKDSPFKQIWIRVGVSMDTYQMKLAMVFPDYHEVDFDFKNDQDLSY